MNEPLNDKEGERPLECSECKKEIAVRYTEIIGQAKIDTCMCADCPILQKKLHGLRSETTGSHAEGGTGLACGTCGTTLDALRVGTPVGCSQCYEVFDEILLMELLNSGAIPPRIDPYKKTTPIHIGRAPGETQELNPSVRLLALNEALDETLKREDYEQAALLRDQIKALTENREKKNNGK